MTRHVARGRVGRTLFCDSHYIYYMLAFISTMNALALLGLDGVQSFFQEASTAEKPAFKGAARANGTTLTLLAEAIKPFASGAKLVTPGAITLVSQPRGMLSMPPEDFDAAEVISRVMDQATEGRSTSIVARYEGIDSTIRPPFATELLSQPDAASPGRARTLHLYVSGPFGSALPPHTDPHDVVVLGVFGEKRWRVCSPGGHHPDLPWRVRTNLQQRCSDVTPEDFAAVECTEYVVRPGDLLFIPGAFVSYS